jgi:hypothetical protein
MVEERHLADDAGSAGGAGINRITEHRQYHLQGTSLRRRGKRGAQEQAIGRSRGGRTTKIHAVANAFGRLIAFDVTAGQMGDVRSAPGLIEKLPKGLSQNKRLGRKDSAMRQQRNERIRKSRGESDALASSLAG